MTATIYRNEIMHYPSTECVECRACNALFFDANVIGLHAVWLYCPLCGMKFDALDTA